MSSNKKDLTRIEDLGEYLHALDEEENSFEPTPDLPEIGAKYAGSAGGIIGTVGLLCSYFVPVIVSSISGDNWTLNFTIESILFLASVLPIAMLPETGAAAKAEMPETSEL